MAEDRSHVERTLADLQRDLTEALENAKRIQATMNTLERMVGAPLTSVVGMTAEGRSPDPSAGGRRGAVRPDEFLGQSPLEAAKQYIKAVGHAVHIDEIADAIGKGGAAVKGGDWREKLEMSLTRSVFDVVKVQEKTFGLTNFYSEEQIRGLRGARRGADSVRPKKKGKQRKSKRRKLAHASPNDATDQTGSADN